MEKLKAAGVKVPDLPPEPELLEEAAWIWVAFHRLSRKRITVDGSPQPIQVSEIAAYATYHGVRSENDLDDLFYLLDLMDMEWLEFVTAKRREAAEKARREAKQRARQKTSRR